MITFAAIIALIISLFTGTPTTSTIPAPAPETAVVQQVTHKNESAEMAADITPEIDRETIVYTDSDVPPFEGAILVGQASSMYVGDTEPTVSYQWARAE